MKTINRLFAVLSPILLYSSFVHSQVVIVDPPALTFQRQATASQYVASNSVLVKVNSDIPWSVTCNAEPLIHESLGTQIPSEQIMLKQNLTDDFQPLNTTIDLGNGEPTAGQELIINTLQLQVSANGQEAQGNYHGTIHIFINSAEAAQILLTVPIEHQLNLSASPEAVHFTTNIPAVYSGDVSVNLMIEGNTENWHVEAGPGSTGSPEFFSGGNVFVKSGISGETGIDEGAGPGFVALEKNPTVLSGAQVGHSGATGLEFKIITDWNLQPGEYNFVVELKIPELGIMESIDLFIQVQEYNIFSLSEAAVHFHANGPPAIWDGDKSVKMTIGSNCGSWSVISEATDLVSPDDVIPKERLYLKIDPGDFSGNEGAGVGYYTLKTLLEVATGAQTPPKEICELHFKLQTLDIDRPGHYEGVITFTQLINP